MAEIYSTAAQIIEKVLQKKGTPKTLVIENTRIRNKKKLYALVCEAIKYKSVTDKLLEGTKLLSLEKQLKYPMALVLVYDFLFGRGLQVGGRLKQVISRNKTSLQAALARMKVKAKVVNNEDLLPQNIQEQQEMQIPRYARVNTLKTSTDDVITWFSENGFKLVPLRRTQEIVDSVEMAKQTFSVDEHVPDVLVLLPGTDLHNNILYKDGKIILQDKASCFPAFVLNPPAGSHVIDACAAPGNKTSHLAAIMDNTGKIFAFDISDKRISTMKKLLDRTGENIVETKHEDFLKVDPNDSVYTNVQYILVDPSCSGSGMINRLDYVTSDIDNMDAKEKQRVRSLAQFQVKVLSHALSFPNVTKVVYSTCSLHDMENEEVVKIVMEKFYETFELKMALTDWPHRGRPLFPEASKCVRASPKEGCTSGFFLALFEAKNSKENGRNKEQETPKGIGFNETKSNPRKRELCSMTSNETFQETIAEERNSETTSAKKRKRPNTSIVEEERNSQINRNNATKCVCPTSNPEISKWIVEKKRNRYKYGRTGVNKAIRVHRKCSEGEFENRLNTLLERRKRRKNAHSNGY